MPQFQKKTPRPEPPEDDARAQLASAIEAAAQAEAGARGLERAAETAFERQIEADHRLEAIRKRHANEAASGADAFIIASMRGDGNIGVAELEAPSKKHAAEIAEAEREIAVLRSVRKEIEARIEPARQAAKDAKGKIEQCARIVLATGIDVPAMLKDAELAASWIIGARSVFLHLMSILPPGPEHDQLAHFLSRPWLMGEYDESWKNNPAIEPYSQALARLKVDAEAKIDIAS